MVRRLYGDHLANALLFDQSFRLKQRFAESGWEANSKGHVVSFADGDHFARVHALGRNRLLTQDRNFRSSEIKNHRFVSGVGGTDQYAVYGLGCKQLTVVRHDSKSREQISMSRDTSLIR